MKLQYSIYLFEIVRQVPSLVTSGADRVGHVANMLQLG